MPEKATKERAQRALREGKRPSTAAGEFVREEIEHVREGKHGARSTKQAIAIGLSKARRAGVPLKPPAKGQVKEATRRSAQRAYEIGQGRQPRSSSAKRSAAARTALKREPRRAASKRALAKQAKQSAGRRRRPRAISRRRASRRSR